MKSITLALPIQLAAFCSQRLSTKEQFARNTILTSLIVLALLASPIGLVSPSALQAEYRIATVDISRVLNETPESKKAKEELDRISQKAKEEIEKKRSSLKKKEERLRDDKVQADSPEADAFRQEAKEFSRYVKDTEEDLRRRFTASNTRVTEKALNLVQQYAKEKSIDLILDKSSMGRGPVLFGTPHVDITDEIISRLKG